jgi:hypothetical protein
MIGGGLSTADETTGAAGPSVIGCDNFTGTNGSSLSGRSALVAAACSNRTWSVHLGTWTIQTNQAASNGTANANATQNTSSADSSVEVVLANLNTGGRVGGVVLSHNGLSNYLAAVMIDGSPDRIELRLYNLGLPSVLSTFTPAFGATNTLRLSRSGSTLDLTLNGAAVGSVTLTALQAVLLGGGTRAGLFGGNVNVRFDDFVVTVP